MEILEKLCGDECHEKIQQDLEMFCDSSSLMDSDWKILIIIYRYLLMKGVEPFTES